MEALMEVNKTRIRVDVKLKIDELTFVLDGMLFDHVNPTLVVDIFDSKVECFLVDTVTKDVICKVDSVGFGTKSSARIWD
jgi:hypothetical protein